MNYKTKNIQKVLKKKGFKEIKDRDHIYFFVYYNGKKSDIFTKLSHSIDEYGDDLLSMVQHQLCLPKKNDLKRLLDCPMGEEEYMGLIIRSEKL